MVKLDLMSVHISKVLLCFLRGARTQTFVVLDLPRFHIADTVFPFLIFWNAVEGFFFFAFADLYKQSK